MPLGGGKKNLAEKGDNEGTEWRARNKEDGVRIAAALGFDFDGGSRNRTYPVIFGLTTLLYRLSPVNSKIDAHPWAIHQAVASFRPGKRIVHIRD